MLLLLPTVYASILPFVRTERRLRSHCDPSRLTAGSRQLEISACADAITPASRARARLFEQGLVLLVVALSGCLERRSLPWGNGGATLAGGLHRLQFGGVELRSRLAL
jgi:hypothetical protein